MSGSGRMSLAFFLAGLATTLAVMRMSGQQHFDCPLAPHLSPCTCTERERGLDISCSDIGAVQLREVIDVIEVTRQTLWFFRLTRAELRHFPKNLLRSVDVRNLIVVMCNVTTLDHQAFSGESSKMESLDLARNSLESVPTKALSSLTSLVALNLDFNSIEVLDKHSFGGLESLLWLSLYGNKIRAIDSRAFLGTEASLTRLNLGGNRLHEVPRYPLHRLNCLQGLRLHDNNISEVSLEFLPPSLCDLDFSGNGVEAIEASSFSVLPHLSSLDLEDNRIRTIDSEAFRGVEDSLEWLKLGGNELSSIPSIAFRNLTRLRQLDLRCNRITAIRRDSFEHYGTTLKYIFLQKNSIRTIEETALEPLESAEWLYLQSNELSQLPESTFRRITNRLQVLDIHDNPFHCDCEILWLRDWLQGKGASVANLPKETCCRSPPGVAATPILKLTNDSFHCSSGATNRPYRNVHIFLIVTVMFLVRLFPTGFDRSIKSSQYGIAISHHSMA